MPPPNLKEATLREWFNYLHDKRGYLEQVRHQMQRMAHSHPVAVRTGATGTGVSNPSFRIDGASGESRAFDGKTFTPFTGVQLTKTGWSNQSMLLAEVQSLIDSLGNR
jgi:hypothetical protein